jgi:hypothetical protein
MALKLNGVSNIKTIHDYTPIEFRGEENAPVFKLKMLSIRQLAELDDSLTAVDNTGGISLKTGSHALKALKMSLVDWANVVDDDDKPLVMKKNGDGTVSDEMLEMIPANIRAELSGAAISMSRFPETVKETLGKL